jgi:hypothetical protein
MLVRSGLPPGNPARICQPVDEELHRRRGPEEPLEAQQNAGPIKPRLKNEPSSRDSRTTLREWPASPVCCPLILDFETASQLNTFITLKYRP